MINIKSKKGITIVSLVIAIVIMLILSTTIVYNVKSTSKASGHNNMIADIKLLEDKLLIYFNKYGEIPKTSRTIKIDDVDYYEIDLSKLDNITLNYGKDYNKEDELTEKSDVYTVNDSLDVYYLMGINISGTRQHEN